MQSQAIQENPQLGRELPPVSAKRVCEGVLDAVGGTPLVHLRRYLSSGTFHLYAKLESLNPGGSIKDRPAKRILEHALSTGILSSGGVVVESSSGNMGIGLAQVCRYHGLRFICVVDPKTTEANLRILQAYGAEIDRVSEPDPETGEFLQARIARAQALVRTILGAFWPNQYANRKNSDSHFHTTMHEVATALGGKVDFVFVPTSTCGTLRCCGEYVRDQGMATRVVAVDTFGSVIFSDIRASRMVPGLGAGIRPPLYEPSLVHEYVHVTDLDCVVGCRRLMEREAILAGGSSGGVLSAVEMVARRIPPDAVMVALLPDRGERYRAHPAGDPGTLREPLLDVRPQFRRRLWPPLADRLTLSGAFGAVSLLLSGLGLYAVITYYVSQRQRELGIRMALGASPSSLMRLVVGQGMRLVLMGLVLGLVIAYASTRLMTSLLFGVGATDVLTFLWVTVLLASTAFAASCLPARRAAKVDPTVSFRAEF